jgi:hypothetical protein
MKTALLASSSIAVLIFAILHSRADTISTTLACAAPVVISVSTAGAKVSCATASAVDPPDDGSASAPLSMPAFPAALKGLKHPPWKVADVDPGYGNGNPLHGTGQLKDWQAPGVMPICASLSTAIGPTTFRLGDVANGSLDGKSAGCSLVGIDFTTHGGAAFYCNAGSHVWFDRDDFIANANVQGGNDLINCSAAASASVTNFDYNGAAPIGPYPAFGSEGLLQFGGAGSGTIGPLIVEHGKAYNVSQHVVDGGPGPSQVLDGVWIEFNTAYQTGTSSQDPNPAHGEFAYLACGTMKNVHEVFNTVIEDGTGPLPLSNTAALALVADSACGAASTTSSELGWNVAIMMGHGAETGANQAAPAGSRAFFLGGPAGATFTGNNIHDNYFTMAGAYFPSDQVPAGNRVSGNINAKTGAVCDLTKPNDRQC